MAAEVPSGVWSTVTDQAPGNAPDAMPTKRPCADVAAYSSPLTESEDVVAAIAAAGLMTRAAAAATGIIHPSHRMTYPPSSQPVSRTPRAPAYASRQRGPTAADRLRGGRPPREGGVWV